MLCGTTKKFHHREAGLRRDLPADFKTDHTSAVGVPDVFIGELVALPAPA
jgi:hypothetical protein